MNPRYPLFLLLAVVLTIGILPIHAGTPLSDAVEYLTRSVSWYHELDVQRQIATDPSEGVTVSDNTQLAKEVVRLSFDFARAQLDSAKTAANADANQPTGPNQRYQSLALMATKLDNQAKELQSEIDGLKQKLDIATGKQRLELRSQISETQSEYELIVARRDALRTITDFASSAGSAGQGTGGGRAQIEALASSLPSDITRPSTAPNGGQATDARGSAAVSSTAKPEPAGIWGILSELFSASRKIRTLDQLVHSTDELAAASKQLRSPQIAALKSLSAQGDTLAAADSDDPEVLAQQKKNIDAITAQFRQVSASVLPLSKQNVLLGLYRSNLTNWQNSLKSQYRADLRNLAVRLGILALILAGVAILAEFWKRAIARYVHEPRRRYQFLLLRQIALWVVIALVVAFSFASQFGSAATFAGLLTAGVAVALQNVISSIVGYFFLIGKFGIRIGDRVQVAGVTGEVVDIGLVRLHLLELGSAGTEVPTGRVVAFSNSVVFQTNGLFRQIPGTNFLWHEMTLTLAADSDYSVIEDRLLGTVEKVFAEYRDGMERQRLAMERTLSVSGVSELKPSSRLRLTPAGIEAVIRYPVDYQHATEMDDRVTRELLKAIEQEPQLKLVSPGTPTIKLSQLQPASRK